MSSCVTATQAAAQRAEAYDKPVQREKSAPATSTAPIQDSVHLSPEGLAALQAKPAEATETYEQTVKEAQAGDQKAIAKLDKQ